MSKNHRNLSAELRGNFLKQEYPIPFGLLDNSDVDALPYSHKRLMSDAFYRAWKYRLHKSGSTKLFFLICERGPFYKKFHYYSFLCKVFDKFEKLGFIQKLGRSKNTYVIEIDKILNDRNL